MMRRLGTKHSHIRDCEVSTELRGIAATARIQKSCRTTSSISCEFSSSIAINSRSRNEPRNIMSTFDPHRYTITVKLVTLDEGDHFEAQVAELPDLVEYAET